MSAEAIQILILKKDRESGFYSYHNQADQDDSRQSSLFWDEMAQKWPKERFSSFFTFDQNG